MQTNSFPTSAQPAPASSGRRITASSLGDPEFRRAHGVRLAYASGAMYKGIASVELVTRMAKAGLLAFFGTGGLRLEPLETAILRIKKELTANQAFGLNLLCNLAQPEFEDTTVDLFLRHGIGRIEAAAYTQVTPSLVRFRVRGLRPGPAGPVIPRMLMAKVSRPEVALHFLSPPPDRILQRTPRRPEDLRVGGRLGPPDSHGGRFFAWKPTLAAIRTTASL